MHVSPHVSKNRSRVGGAVYEDASAGHEWISDPMGNRSRICVVFGSSRGATNTEPRQPPRPPALTTKAKHHCVNKLKSFSTAAKRTYQPRTSAPPRVARNAASEAMKRALALALSLFVVLAALVARAQASPVLANPFHGIDREHDVAELMDCFTSGKYCDNACCFPKYQAAEVCRQPC